jgi:uncharacterized protein YhaN
MLNLFANPTILLGTMLGVVVLAGGSGWAGYTKGYNACERDQKAATADALRQAQENYHAEVERGNTLSNRLAEKQREIRKLKDDHEDYARSIAGTCPDGVRLLHDAAALDQPLPETARSLAGEAGTVAARDLAQAINRNYAACNEYRAQLDALIDWHRGAK